MGDVVRSSPPDTAVPSLVPDEENVGVGRKRMGGKEKVVYRWVPVPSISAAAFKIKLFYYPHVPSGHTSFGTPAKVCGLHLLLCIFIGSRVSVKLGEAGMARMITPGVLPGIYIVAAAALTLSGSSALTAPLEPNVWVRIDKMYTSGGGIGGGFGGNDVVLLKGVSHKISGTGEWPPIHLVFLQTRVH